MEFAYPAESLARASESQRPETIEIIYYRHQAFIGYRLENRHLVGHDAERMTGMMGTDEDGAELMKEMTDNEEDCAEWIKR